MNDNISYNLNTTEDSNNTIYLNTTHSMSGMQYSYSYILTVQVLHYMKLYFTPSLITVGVLGNTISCLILLRAKLRNFSSSQYLLALCMVNSIYLVVTLMKWLAIHGIVIYTRPGLCQVMSFLENSAIFLSNWYVVAFCVDRYIVFCLSTEGTRLCNKVRARIVITALCVIAVIVYINISITEGVVVINGQFRCRPLPFFMHNLQLLVVIKGVLNVILPYACIFLLSILTVVNIHVTHIRNIFSDDNSPSLLKKTTLVYLLLFYILHAPFELYHLFNIFRGILHPYHIISGWEFLTQAFLMHLFNLSMAMHLPIYVSTYPLFRNYVKQACTRVTTWRVCSMSPHNKPVKETMEFTGINQDESTV